MELINLDDENEVAEFIAKYGTTKGRRLANMLGIKGPGAVTQANWLSGYAWNKQTAINLRKRGQIETALIYEDICEGIYKKLAPEYKW